MNMAAAAASPEFTLVDRSIRRHQRLPGAAGPAPHAARYCRATRRLSWVSAPGGGGQNWSGLQTADEALQRVKVPGDDTSLRIPGDSAACMAQAWVLALDRELVGRRSARSQSTGSSITAAPTPSCKMPDKMAVRPARGGQHAGGARVDRNGASDQRATGRGNQADEASQGMARWNLDRQRDGQPGR